ncbi:putative AlkP superfamily phosphohydrolase/phosphomutase [Rhodovulum bhavnagarense]|uniref:Putative AlkP superfamily phosphohydrolase/phosphomutase n=1 Tax=Rhodovulum bhavnagarense TaxID=992286 RepID=A0A4R2RLD9_9RHOB|nr:alkaline phosphatase family protein [Rhodovulum bhavnagarense]TCP63429.1 putative AlkP superfamily phosphohydrolase/phosphomutase [Rhodovulum bhavnagarense]
MTQTFLLGLDGASYTVLRPLIDGSADEGVVMPYLAGLVADGYSATLRSTAHPLTPPAWTSVCTGRTPGHHGIYDFVRFEDMGDDIYFTLYDSRDIRCETLWQIAGRAGKTVASLNFPMMAPPQEVNGALVPGFVSWKHLRRNTWPRELYDRIKTLDGFDPREMSWDFERESQIGDVMPDDELHDWVEKHLPRDHQWFNIGLHLLREDNPDLMALMLDGTDKIQHQAWHVLDPRYWNPSEASHGRKKVRALVLDYFRGLDGYIRELHQAAGPDCQFVIVSDHGFTGAEKVVRINKYLESLGVLAWRAHDGSEAARRRDLANFANLDWTRTRAYCPTPSSNGVVIRVKSDKNPGGVDPAEYESFRAGLIAELLALRDPETGEAVIREVLKREDAFPGPAMGQAPDLTLVLSDHGFVSVRNLAPAVVTRPVPMGTHHPDGIFIMTGPGVRRAQGAVLSIVDTTAIVAHGLGLDIPADFEGRVPDDLFDGAWLTEHPVRIGGQTAAQDGTPAHDGDEADEDQREEVLAQLRLLGYLED